MAVTVLTPAHWVYLAGVVVIIITMARRSNVVAPAMLATFATALAMTGNFAKAIEALFFGPLTAAGQLFNIFLVIALMTGFMNALRSMGSDVRMVQPFRRVMVNADAAFLILGAVSYLLALFFWPTPSVPLIAGILLPAAIYAGVPPMAAAVCIAIAGLGMALSSDYVIKVAPGISAKMAGVPMSNVADKALVLSLITGLTAFIIAYIRLRPSFSAPSLSNLTEWEETIVDANGTRSHRPVAARSVGAASVVAVEETNPHHILHGPVLTGIQEIWSKLFAIFTPVCFLAVVTYMVLPKLVPGFKGASGDAAAGLVGGVAALMLVLATAAFDPRNICRNVAANVTEGLVFSFRAMGSVLSIAGFFFIGVATTAGPIVGLPSGEHAPGLLADLVHAGDVYAPHNAFFSAFTMLLSGMVTGIDGSGFAGLPLTGALAGALGRSIGFDVSTLAAIGQMGSVWTGKTLCAWSALAAVAGFARVPVLEAVRNLLLPVVSGLIVSTVFAVIFW